MPINSTIVDGIIHTELSGEISYDMIVAYLNFVYTLRNQVENRYELHDHTNTKSINLCADEMRQVTAYSRKCKDVFPQTVLAVYVPDDFTFGIARMFETFAEMEGLGINARIFRDRDSAIRFLRDTKNSAG